MKKRINLNSRSKLLSSSLIKEKQELFLTNYSAHKNGWDGIQEKLLQAGLDQEDVQMLELVNELADITDDNARVVTTLQKKVSSVREMALTWDLKKIRSLLKDADISEGAPGDTVEEKKEHYARQIEKQLYHKEPSAVITRLVKNGMLPVKDAEIRNGVLSFFEQHPAFNIRKTSVYAAAANHQVAGLSKVDPLQRAEVMDTLKQIQRVSSLSDEPELLPRMMNAGLTSAHKIVSQPQDAFVKTYATQLGGEQAATQVYTQATDINIRNEQALTALREMITGTPVAAINGSYTTSEKRELVKELAAANGVQLNWEALFGNADLCECDECRSVYSASNYLVELLQFLRNNNLDPDKPNSTDISGTVLEKLFKRRPDLGNLQLTCENANTALPYIDLVNEILESFVIHLPQYQPEGPAQLEVFNVQGETSSELLAVPQHINYAAYSQLQQAVYPFNLPYHQPIDAIRILLNKTGTGRHELMDVFRSAGVSTPGIINRAVDAELLGLTEEEYVIITKEGFLSKPALESKNKKRYTDADYQRIAGVKPVWEYYGYSSEQEMITKLKEVKKGFLQRTGITYKELSDLLQTSYINPAFPSGRALVIMQQLPYSYRFLQSLVVNATDPATRYAQVIGVLEALYTEPAAKAEVRNWVLQSFENIGKIIVLEGGGTIDDGDHYYYYGQSQVADTCDISKIKLQHLDGTDLTAAEYDRIHRFIRICKKLSWTVEETDRAIVGVGNGTISSLLVHQLVAVRKLLQLTRIPLKRLLAFWANIDTRGERSLYHELFLNHNIKAIDPVFQPDANGNYLTGNENINDHLPALMAALQLTAADITTMRPYMQDDVLSLTNVSTLFRYGTLARNLRCSIAELWSRIWLMGSDTFTDAYATMRFIETLNDIGSARFSIAQLNYIINDLTNEPEGMPTESRTVILQAKALHEGLLAIEQQHADVPAEEMSIELLTAKLQLLFDEEVVKRIVALVEGTTIYSAPYRKRLPGNIVVPDELKDRFSYDPGKSRIAAKGILSEALWQKIIDLSADVNYRAAILNIQKQPEAFFNDTLFGVFADSVSARQNLLAPDEEGTAKLKALYCWQQFLPFLKKKLNQQLITESLAANMGLDKEVTDVLINTVLKAYDDVRPLYADFENVKDRQQEHATEWEGFVTPALDDTYTFVATADAPVQIWLNDEPIVLAGSAVTNKEYETMPRKLKGGQLYRIRVSGISNDLAALSWKTPTSPRTRLSDSVLFPATAGALYTSAYIRLFKATQLVKGFKLQAAELEYFNTHANDFDGLNFNAITLQQWKRLYDYTRLKNILPATGISITGFFNSVPGTNVTGLPGTVAALTGISHEVVEKLMAPAHFNLGPADFLNEKALLKLLQAVKIAVLTGIDVDRLFAWANPNSDFSATHNIAESIRHALQARYSKEEWEQVVKPLNDQLRANQKQALISYLLVQPALQQWADARNQVLDADALFEFFLIDVQMEPVMETSRIKQAISSVQTYIQRCFLGLEPDVTVDALDKDRWEWMQKYRVWEANRKVFLYPENWAEPDLRDSKSPFFKELEAELLQKELTQEVLENAVRNYLNKLEEVGDLSICAMYQQMNEQDPNVPEQVHVFARTRNAPYNYYYRRFEVRTHVWTAWEKVEADIQEIEDDGTGQLGARGTYLIPAVWQNRLFLFWPLFTKRKAENTINTSGGNRKVSELSMTQLSTFSSGQLNPKEYWEIKLGYTEYKNRQWTPGQISSAFVNTNGNATIPSIAEFFFICDSQSEYLRINVCYTDNGFKSTAFVFKPGNVITAAAGEFFDMRQFWPNVPTYRFNNFYAASTGNVDLSLYDGGSNEYGKVFSSTQTDYKIVRSFQKEINNYRDPIYPFVYQEEHSNNTLNRTIIGIDNYTAYDGNDLEFELFHHPYVGSFSKKLNTEGLKGLFSYLTQASQQFAFSESAYNPVAYETWPLGKVDFGYETRHGYSSDVAKETYTSYAVYNWELFFHIPLLIADRLSKDQQFEQAMEWFHYIFNPLSKGPEADVKRYWQFLPFKIDASDALTKVFYALRPNQPNADVNAWREDPFNPHLVARSRPTAYMKLVVMKYLDNLVAWGDNLYRQNTLETINQAIMLYVMAGHILGPRPQVIPSRGKILPQTYNSLLNKWDAFSNAMVEMELVFPYSGQVTYAGNNNNGKPYPGNNIYGFGAALYFGIPDNPQLLGYWDTVADRLFKIRNSMNIDGIVQKLPLFEPPIDPALIVQASAQGISLSQVLNDLHVSMPCYRFHYLTQKALELCSEVRSLGSALLSVLEKKDAEALTRLRAGHEVNTLKLVKAVKEKQLEEARAAVDTLLKNRETVTKRLQHYQTLLGVAAEAPAVNGKYKELGAMTRKVIADSGLKLIDYEKEDMDKAAAAAEKQKKVGSLELIASVLNVLPSISGQAEPLGVGVSISFGGPQLGAAFSAKARMNQTDVNNLTFQSGNAAKKNSLFRQRQDWVLQANMAGNELMQLDKQIVAANIRIDMAAKELDNHLVQVEQSKETEAFLRSKYTGQELYQWLEKQTRLVYYQAYQLAFDMAKKAEKTYRFERGETNTNFIQFGYWDSSREGFLAGEHLTLAIKQMEKAYADNHKREYEIKKHISLAQLDPSALLTLQHTGVCELQLPEEMFDLDFPGHYMRRIKTVAVSIPCIAGPYTSISATLTLLQDTTRIKSLSGSQYAEDITGADDRFVHNFVSTQSITTSSAQNDSGVFELNFRDERYLPFEGAGAVSRWRLELPAEYRQFDYDTIADVILHLSYTAREGGGMLKAAAIGNLDEFVQRIYEESEHNGLAQLFNLRQEFSAEWHRFLHPVNGVPALQLKGLQERLPFYTRSRKVSSKLVTHIELLVRGNVDEIQLNDMPLNGGAVADDVKRFTLTGDLPSFNDAWRFTTSALPDVQNAWLIVHYSLQVNQ